MNESHEDDKRKTNGTILIVNNIYHATDFKGVII